MPPKRDIYVSIMDPVEKQNIKIEKNKKRCSCKGCLCMSFFLGVIGVVVIGALVLVFYESFEASNYGEMFVTVLYPSLGFGAIFALRSFHLDNIGFLFMITIMIKVIDIIIICIHRNLFLLYNVPIC